MGELLPDLEPELVQVLTDEDWQLLRSLTQKTETWRYNSEMAGRYVGRNLWTQILRRMDAQKGQKASAEHGGGKFYLYSAHYPTLLGMLAALDKTGLDETEVVPTYASALIFELHEEGGVEVVKVFYRRGQPATGSTERPVFPVNDICGNLSEMCTLPQMISMLDGWTEEQWCKECENLTADVCVRNISQECIQTKQKDDFLAWGLFIALSIGVSSIAIFFFRCRSRGIANNKNEIPHFSNQTASMGPI